MVAEGELLWTPRPELAAASNLSRYLRWLASERGRHFADYQELWHWSVTDLEGFWRSIWDYFEVVHEGSFASALDQRKMLGVRWFDGARVNYAEHLLRHASRAGSGEVAFRYVSESDSIRSLSWSELQRQVHCLGSQLRAMGIRPGDRVVSYMPNVPETAIAMMATAAIGAVWSSAAIEFGAMTVINRFAQITPKVLFAADGYRFGGKHFSRESEVRRIIGALPSLTHVVVMPHLKTSAATFEHPLAVPWSVLVDVGVGQDAFHYERVACDHPLWIVFSSGTTGLPKAIVHGHVGVLLEHLKKLHFHLNLKRGSVMLFYSTTGWMMWNVLISALLAGATAVLYDGNPAYPRPDLLWRLAAEARVTSFGASPTYVQVMAKAGLRPGETFDLSALESIVVTGAPSTPETFQWLYECVKRDLWVTSQSGGTEICSGFVGAAPTLPVYAGEIQTRLLGMDVHVWNESGKEVIDEVGELVVTSPSPSMPLRFWNDPDNVRYRETYFEHFPGVWRHGDFMKLNARGGCYIYGRSDSTLNRNGVRIGSAEIYRAVEQIPEVADSIVVCCELPGGQFFMPLFLKLRVGAVLDDALRARIAQRLREDCSPRHVADGMYDVDAIPYTLTGKKMEIPVRRILMGWLPERAVRRDAMVNPFALDWYVRFAQESMALSGVRQLGSRA